MQNILFVLGAVGLAYISIAHRVSETTGGLTGGRTMHYSEYILVGFLFADLGVKKCWDEFKAALIHICILKIDQMAMCKVKGVIRSNNSTNNPNSAVKLSQFETF